MNMNLIQLFVRYLALKKGEDSLFTLPENDFFPEFDDGRGDPRGVMNRKRRQNE